jgi:hypothetical protein
MMMATITCYSAADCNEGGTGRVCCYSTTTNATSCVPGQCAAGDYTQCASSDSECPAGDHCVMSPLGGSVHYCMAGGSSREGGASEGGGSSEGGAGEAGTRDAATE